MSTIPFPNNSISIIAANPNGLVSAPPGSIFIREGTNFYLSVNGVVTSLSQLSLQTFVVILYGRQWRSVINQASFQGNGEIWVQTSSTGGTQGWTFASYGDYFYTYPSVTFITGDTFTDDTYQDTFVDDSGDTFILVTI
jgi:hypothetical protein